MKKDNWDEEVDNSEYMVDLLFDTSLSLNEISKEVGWPLAKVNQKINQLGLSWLKNSRKKMSRGQTALTAIMQKLLPGEKIINEYVLGDKLRLDVYCPSYQVGAEYHGRQHFFYTAKFFDSKYDFEEAQKRDQKKIELCKEMGIALIIFRYNDMLTEQAVYDRLLQAIRLSPHVPENIKTNKKSITQNKFYQDRKKQYNERKKETYKKMKKRRDNHE